MVFSSANNLWKYQRIAGEAIFEIGKRLKHVKEYDLAHGEWEQWLSTIGMTKVHANRFMRVFERFEKVTPGLRLPNSITVLYALTSYSDEELEIPREMPDGTMKKLTEITVRIYYELTDDDRLAIAYKNNTLTRELSREEKIAKAIELRKEGRSYTQIADWLGVSHPTVMRWVRDFETCSDLQVAKIEGSDGKERPAEKPTDEALEQRRSAVKQSLDSGKKPKEIAEELGVYPPAQFAVPICTTCSTLLHILPTIYTKLSILN